MMVSPVADLIDLVAGDPFLYNLEHSQTATASSNLMMIYNLSNDHLATLATHFMNDSG